MDEVGLILLGIFVVLAFPVIAIIALVIAINVRSDARNLRERLDALENARPAAPAAALAAAFAPPPPIIETPPEAVIAPPPPARPEPQPVEAPAAVPTAAPETAPASATLEERFGTQWVVWIGGLALALGAIFLVRYTIEQGLLGPGVRIFLAAVFAGLLIAAGEWARRNEVATGIAAIPSRHIPSVLTAAGTVAAYATVYAAFALYSFLSPAAAFILLGLVALATLAAALLHGPALAGLGVAGAFVTPLLVSTNEPSYWALYAYLFVVNAAAFALARLRLWRWLAITAVVLGALWTLPGITNAGVDALGAHLFHVIAGFALAAALIVSGLLYGPDDEPGKIDGISSGAIGAYLVVAAIMVTRSHQDPAAFSRVHASRGGDGRNRLAHRRRALGTADGRTDDRRRHAAMGAAADFRTARAAAWRHPWRHSRSAHRHRIASRLGRGAGSAVRPCRLCRTGTLANPVVQLYWSATGVLTPLVILIALYLRIAEFDRSVPFAGLALLLAALYGYATELLSQRETRPGIAASAAVFATGAVATLALALTLALDKGWLTVGLALMVPGIAWICEQRPLPALRALAAGVVVLVLLRVGYEPRIVGDDIGTTPIFNWILYGYGVPAASFWYAGYLLRRRADDVPARMADAAAILFTVLLAFLEIRHYMTGGNLYAHVTALAEVALQVSVGLAMTIGLERLRLRSRSVVHNFGALAVGAITLAAIVFGLILVLNPFMNTTEFGGPFFNIVLLAYGIPALLAAILAVSTRGARPLPYRHVAAATAVILSLFYLTLEVRRLFHGSMIGAMTPITDAEQYTYSAIWLAFGVVLLIAGVFVPSQPARLASAAVVAITIAKVFLVDLAGLTGIFQALSFIGLGAVLIGIALLYQRLLFPARAQVITAGTDEAGNSDG